MMLLEHFNELSLHPKNVSNLKGFILRLASQGKLTANWRKSADSNQDIKSYLQEIKSTKELLVSQKIFKAKYETNEFEPSLIRPPIPITWRYVPVGKIAELITGATPSKAKSEYFGGDIKWLVSGNIHLGRIYDCEGRITEEGLESCNCKILPIDSVMIALNGQGKTRATVALLKTPATCNQSLVAIKPFIDNTVLSEYIYYYLKGLYLDLRDITGRDKRRGLNLSLISTIPIALPPPEEQKAIVQIVEQLFKEVEQLESLTKTRITLKEDFATSALRRLTEEDTTSAWAYLKPHFQTFFTEEANVKKLRESILQLAVQGKLTAKWRAANPEREHASLLLERIKEEKAQLIKEKKIRKEKPLPPITEEEMPFELPEGWVWCRLGTLSKRITDGEHQTPPRIPNGRKLLSAKNIRDGYIDYENCEHISEEHYQKSIKRCNPEVGDLLIVSVGGTIGRVSMIEKDIPFALVRSVAMVKNLGLVPNYLRWVMNSPLLQELIESKKRGGAQPCLYLGEIREFVFPLAPYAEQEAISQVVNDLFKKCQTMEKNIRSTDTIKNQWMQSCLRELFAGNKKEVEHV